MVLHYVTAYQLLHRVVKAEPTERVLVHEAAGGVGLAILQLGLLHGLQLFGTATHSGLSTVRSLGGVPIDSSCEDVTELLRVFGGVDAALDPIGGWNWVRSYRALRSQGRLAGYGGRCATSHRKTSKPMVALSFILLGFLKAIPDSKSVRWYSIRKSKAKWPGYFRQDLDAVFALLAAKKIQPIIAERLQLGDVVRAHDLLEHGHVSGELVLLCEA